eukprot:scaffold12.g8251.t1
MAGRVQFGPELPPALQHPMASLGDELLVRVLEHVSPADLAAAELTCRRWLEVVEAHALWRTHAASLQDAGAAARAPGAAAAPTAPAAASRPAAAGAAPPALLLPPPQAASAAAGADPSAGLSWKQRYLRGRWARAHARPDCFKQVALHPEAHSGAVAACSVLGDLLATASADASVRLFRLRGGWRARAAAAAGAAVAAGAVQHPEPLFYVRLLTPHTLVSAGPSGGYLWRFEPLSERRQQQRGPGGASAAGAGGGTAPLPQLGATLVRRFGAAPSGGGALGARCAAAWGEGLALGMADGTVRIYDLYSGSLRIAITDVDSTLVLAEVPGGALQSTPALLLEPSQALLFVSNGPALTCFDLSSLPSPEQRSARTGQRLASAPAHARAGAGGAGAAIAAPGLTCLDASARPAVAGMQDGSLALYDWRWPPMNAWQH